MVFAAPLEIGDVFITGEAPSRWAKVSRVGAGVEVGVEARSGMWFVARSFGLEEMLEAALPETSSGGEGVRKKMGLWPFVLPVPSRGGNRWSGVNSLLDSWKSRNLLEYQTG